MSVFHAPGELFLCKTLAVPAHVPVERREKKRQSGKLVVVVLHIAEQLFECVVNSRTEFSIFIFGRRDADEILEIKFQRTFEKVVQRCYVHLEILHHPVNEIHFDALHLRWLLTLQEQELKIAESLCCQYRLFYRQFKTGPDLFDEYRRLGFFSVISKPAIGNI